MGVETLSVGCSRQGEPQGDDNIEQGVCDAEPPGRRRLAYDSLIGPLRSALQRSVPSLQV